MSFVYCASKNDNTSGATAKGFWKYEILKSMVRITNKQMLILEDGSTELPPCQSITQILKFKFSNFKFNSKAYGSKYFTCSFFIFGSDENEVYLKPFFMESSSEEIILQLLNPRSTYIDKGKFMWYIVPLRIMKNPHLFLQVLPDKASLELKTSCCQSGMNLSTSEPIIYLQGFPSSCPKKVMPYLLAQKTSQFNKKYARVHSIPGNPCPVNSIRVGHDYVKVSTGLVDPNRDIPLSVGLTLSNDAIIAFKYNPYSARKCEWNSTAMEIRYFGPTLTLPPQYITEIYYNNEYDVPLSKKIVSMVLSDCHNKFLFVYPTQWQLNKPLKLLVRNSAIVPIELHHGDTLATAYFVFLANRGNLGTLMRKYIKRQHAMMTLPGEIHTELSDFVSFERLAKSSTINLNKIK